MKRTMNAKEFFEFIEKRDKAKDYNNERYELIDGYIYAMASPKVRHQDIAGIIYRKIGNYLDGKKCRVFIAPLDVVLFEKSDKSKYNKDKARNVFQPDIFVVCNEKKIGENRIYGTPDFIIEVLSDSTAANDLYYKLNLYMKFGVREYWIVDPKKNKIIVFFGNEKFEYSFADKIKVNIFEDLEIDFSEIKGD